VKADWPLEFKAAPEEKPPSEDHFSYFAAVMPPL
jgi:hypothetical protein